MSKIRVIINPTAGKVSNMEVEDIVRESLEKDFDYVEIVYTKKPKDGTILAKEAAKLRYEAVCSIGGDGTLNEILAGIVNEDYRPKLLIIPGGTGNILAKTLGIPQNIRQAFKKLNINKTRKIDIGQVGEDFFSVSYSFGVIPSSIHNVSKKDKSRFGMLAYIFTVARNIGKGNEFKIHIESDEFTGNLKVDHLIVTLSNKFGIFKFSNIDSDIADGYGNVFILTSPNFFDKVKAGVKGMFGRMEEVNKIKHFRTRRLKITSLEKFPIATDLDGDRGGNLPSQIKILNGRIEIFLFQ